jgi:hypothetical protein
MTAEIFEFIRILAISVAVMLRVILMPIYLQAYLNLAYDRIEDQKKEAGRITNVEYKQVCIFLKIEILTNSFFILENFIYILLSLRCGSSIYCAYSALPLFIVHLQDSGRIFTI